MYFVRMCPEDEKKHSRGLGKKAVQLTPNLYQVKFSFSDLFSDAKIICLTKLCFFNKKNIVTRSEVIYDKGIDIVYNQMDIIQILKYVRALPERER